MDANSIKTLSSLQKLSYKTFELFGLNFCFIIGYPPYWADRIVTIFTFQTGDIKTIFRRSVTSQVLPGTSNEF